MPLEAQTRLLRVLQGGEYTTVGGRVPIKTDVRIIAATNRDLRQLIQQGLFREDLFYRLNVVPMRLPPLRERVEDIPDLVRHFLRKTEAEGLPLKRLEPAATERLKLHNWPGNVRELENLIRRLVVLNPDETITEEAVAQELLQLERTMPPTGEEEKSLGAMVERYLATHFAEYGDQLPPAGLYDRILQEIERPLIAISLVAARGNQIRAAQLLGLNRNTLRKKIRELGVEVIRGLKSH
jgi:two-component system nitrogen regulation response regulator GlnG